MLKKCIVCKQDKETAYFYKSSKSPDGFQTRCSSCALITAKKHYRDNRADFAKRANDLLSRLMAIVNVIKERYGCCFCGLKNYKCLDFHHINPETKLDSVGELVRKKSTIKVFEEINKCVVVCSNCHRLIHFGDLIPDKSKACFEPIPIKESRGRKANNIR